MPRNSGSSNRARCKSRKTLKYDDMKKALLLMAVSLLAVTAAAGQKTVRPEAFRLGGYEIYVLTENAGEGSTGILIDAPESVLREYAPGGTFPNAVNAVLVRGKGKVWLIDTGFGRHIFDMMAGLGISPGDVDYVLLTHMHGDHTGGMFRNGAKAFPNAEVVVSQKEYDYWSSRAEMEKLPENRRGNFVSAQKIFTEYGERLKTVDPYRIGNNLPEGISPVAAYGHTPGHIMFMVRDGREQLLVWGDLTHALAVQMPHPEISVTYDTDPEMARQSRMEVLRHIAEKDSHRLVRNIPVVGMHIPAVYPGRVYGHGNGDSYEFVVLPMSE